LLGLWLELFPRCFTRFRRRPLKIGIHNDIIDRVGELGAVELKSAMRCYCGQRVYLMACTEGATRIDLDGNAAGIVTAEEAAHAKAALDRLTQKAFARAFAKRRQAREERSARLVEERKAVRAESNAKAWAEYHERKAQWRQRKAEQQQAAPIPATEAAPPKRLGLADLRRAGQQRQRVSP
jgi:sRNA-binding protein